MDFELTQQEFDQISRLIHDKSGIALHEGKRELVRARLTKRLRETGMPSFQAYYDYVVKESTGRELVIMLDSISTNMTSFFREPAHFTYLASVVIPWLAARHGPLGHRLWIWSAGCSTGEEPYSIALSILEALPNPMGWDIKLLGTDISTRALETAQRGIYKADKLSTVPSELRTRYFQRGTNEWAGYHRVKPEVQRLIEFRHANLLHGAPIPGQFDVIFCRNVMIYFDNTTQARAIDIFRDRLLPGGHLFIGHSESLARVKHCLQYVRPAMYCKPEEQGH
jgi:chemotaxis protein methyltransferase CheR